MNNYSIKETISLGSINQYRLGLKYLTDDLNKPFKEATQEDIEQHLSKYKQSTRNQRITVFHNFYRWLFKLDENDPLPKCVRGFRVKHVPIDEIAYRERLVTEEEYNLLLEYAKQPVEKAVIECMSITGGRKGELQKIRVGDVTFDGKTTKITIRISKTKSRVAVYLGRAEHLLKWCETLAPNRNEKGMPLFTTSYRRKVVPIHDLYAWRVPDRTCKRAGLRHIKPHDLRHTNCTKLLRNGVPETFVKNQLGFSRDSVMLRVYDHNDESDYENYLNGKGHEVQPTYELLQKQNQELETQRKQEIATLKERLATLESDDVRTQWKNMQTWVQKMEKILKEQGISDKGEEKTYKEKKTFIEKL